MSSWQKISKQSQLFFRKRPTFFRTEEADVIVHLLNPHDVDFIRRHAELIDAKKLIIVCSKCDTLSTKKHLNLLGTDVIYISSVTGEGMELLKSKIVEIALRK